MATSSPKSTENPWRTHRCDAITLDQKDERVRLCGWIDRKRDHGNLLFVDLRDQHAVVQCVIEKPEGDKETTEQARVFAVLEDLPLESVVSVRGRVGARSAETINPRSKTGSIELLIEAIEVLSRAAPLPLPVAQAANSPENLRLKYRFLDLRRPEMRDKILLRSRVISFLRRRMESLGFTEFQTPILTASSPEGARDFLVPSRLHAHKFYALPQAPQQFKQLLMIAGFERYFQIAPCFRDEDARADRSPGEFYQLDFEMAFVTQEEVMQTIEPVLFETFQAFGGGVPVTSPPFPRLSYAEAMLRYGTDKPDLRNPIRLCEVGDLFAESGFKIFSQAVLAGAVVRALPAPGAATRPRSFFDGMQAWARAEGQKGLGYILYPRLDQAQGPIARNLDPSLSRALAARAELKAGDALFFVCGQEKEAALFAGRARTHIARALDCCQERQFAFCWIVDFPMFAEDEQSGKIVFSHNPFSMPQGGEEALLTKPPLDITACQYDIVCNGVELSSGAIRNHDLATLRRAFAVAGYAPSQLEAQFPAMVSALRYGVPPHGGAAPGIERIVMLLCGESNIREVTCFPLMQSGQDLLMGAPCAVDSKVLQALHIALRAPPR